MEVSLVITGAEEALSALRVLEPQVAKEVGKRVSAAGQRIAAAMRATTPTNAPASHWVGTSGIRGSRNGAGWPAWAPISYSVSRRGMTVRVTGSSDPPAIMAMFETMGKGTHVTKASGRKLIENMNAAAGPVKQSGSKGKIGRARRVASEQVPQTRRDIQIAVDYAVAEVNRRMP